MRDLVGCWQTIPRSLLWRWLVVGTAGGLALACWYVMIPPSWFPQTGIWFSAGIWFYLWLFTGWNLDRHRRSAGKPVLGQLGAGNGLTLIRGWFLSIMAGYLIGSTPVNFGRWLPMIAYTTSDVADYFDGYLARRQGIATGLGEALDLELDSLGLLLAVLVAIHLGALPWWFLIFGLARYGYSSMIKIRQYLELPVYELPASKIRRPIAGLTMGYVSASLWPILDQPELTLAGMMFLVPFSASFVRDGLVVGGWLDPETERYQVWRNQFRQIILEWFPLVFRLGVLILLVVEVPRLLSPSETLQFAMPSEFVLMIFAIITAVTSLAMVLGIAARFAAFIEVFPLGLTVSAASLDGVRAVALVCVIALLMLGGGRASIWQPSDQIFALRAGESPAL